MMNKFKDIIWNIRASFIPTVTYDYIKKHDGSWSANYPEKDNYVYYWIGDFKTGKQVKVKSIEILKDMIDYLNLEIYELQNYIDTLTREDN